MLTKEQAIEHMLSGGKVTHSYFMEDEWMTMVNPKLILFQDGVEINPDDFWSIRIDGWESGYSIVNKP